MRGLADASLRRYDLFAAHYEATEGQRARPGEVEWYTRYARIFGAPFLELGAGAGRLLLSLARAGLAGVGLDASPAMLAIARRKLGDAPIDLVQGRMEDFRIDRKFGSVILAYNSFALLLTLEDQVACLDYVREHLVPGGALLADLNHCPAEVLVASKEWREWSEPVRDDDRRAHIRRRAVEIEAVGEVVRYLFEYEVRHDDGRVESVPVPFGVHTLAPPQFVDLVEECGFRIERLDQDFHGSAYRRGAPQVVVVARRG